eukprot:1679339-Karenia_brevis.AAC.1
MLRSIFLRLMISLARKLFGRFSGQTLESQEKAAEIGSLLQGDALSCVNDSVGRMLLTDEELEAVHEGGVPNTYMDPVLANNEKEYAKFIARLAQCGVVGFSESVRCQCGIFFVKKKS